MLEAGPQLRPRAARRRCSRHRTRRRCAASARRTSRSASTTPRSTAAGRCPASPTCARTEDPTRPLRLVARAHAGRPHQSLGPHLAAQRSVRFQAAQPRRPRLRLADHLRRHRAVLRQGRDADRRLRQQRRPGEHAGLARRAACCRRRSRASATCWSQQRAEHARHSGRSPAIARCSRSRSITRRSPAQLHPGNATAQKILAEDMRSRAACFWATPCGRGCSIRANYQSTTVHLPPALATGNLDIIDRRDGATRSRSTRDGRATGVSFIDQHHRQAAARDRARRRARRERLRDGAHPAQLEERAVPERARQLQRQGRPLPDGHGRQQRRAARSRCSRACRRTTRTAPTATQLYVPWWLYQEQLAGKLGFARGYHIEFGGGRRMPGYGTGAGTRMADRRQLRREVQGGRAPLLRLVHRTSTAAAR